MFQNRPAAKFVVFLILGILIGWYGSFSILSSLIILGVITVITLVAHLRLKNSSSPLFSTALICLLIVFGIFKITYDRDYTSQNHISHFINPNEEVTLTATIVDPASQKGRRVQFVAEVESLHSPILNEKIEGEVLVTIITKTTLAGITDSLGYGKRISATGYLEEPQPARNPGDFDFRKYLQLKNISAQFFIKNQDSLALVGEGGNWFYKKIVFTSRKWISQHIDAYIGGGEGNFLKGVIVGDRSDLDAETKNVFINAGVMHILAVSGSNVVFIILIFSSIFTAFRFSKTLSLILTCIVLILYIFLTGNSASVIRAVTMALIYLTGKHCELYSDNYNTIAVAAIIILLSDAKQLFDPGFQLSFAAVFSLFYFYPSINSLYRFLPAYIGKISYSHNIWNIGAATLAATLGTLPFTTLYFEKISLVGMITNLFCIPVSGLLLALGCTVLLFSSVSPWFATIYAAGTKLLTFTFLWIIEFVGRLHYASFDLRLSVIESLFFYIVLFLLFYSFGEHFRKRIIILLLLIGNFFIYRSIAESFKNENDRLRITILDIGQGDAIHIHFPTGENILIDGGPRTRSFDAGARIVLPYLKRQNIEHLNAIIVTHPHDDHLGGISSILREMKVDSVIDAGVGTNSNIFKEYTSLLDSLNIPRKTYRRGMVLGKIPNIRMYTLHPSPQFLDAATNHNLNNTSLVFKIVYNSTTLLLEGDAEQEAEENMTRIYGNFLKSSVLKIGHHGSRTSTTEGFLHSVNPELAVISDGIRNKFHHPSKITLQHLKETKVQVYRTDQQGAIIFESDDSKWNYIDWRN